jgi:hypothetical protein
MLTTKIQKLIATERIPLVPMFKRGRGHGARRHRNPLTPPITYGLNTLPVGQRIKAGNF